VSAARWSCPTLQVAPMTWGSVDLDDSVHRVCVCVCVCVCVFVRTTSPSGEIKRPGRSPHESACCVDTIYTMSSANNCRDRTLPVVRKPGHLPPLSPKVGWLGSRVVSVLDSVAEGPWFKSQSRRCRVTVLGKLFTPIVPL